MAKYSGSAAGYGATRGVGAGARSPDRKAVSDATYAKAYKAREDRLVGGIYAAGSKHVRNDDAQRC